MTYRRVLAALFALVALFASSCSSGATIATNVSGSTNATAGDETGLNTGVNAGPGPTTTDTGVETSADVAGDGPMKVGFVTTLSGGAAYMGEDLRDGMNLAFDLDASYPIELVALDDGQDPTRAAQAALQLLDQENVDLMTGIIFSNIALAVVPTVIQRDMIYISPNAGPSALAGADCHQNFFNTAFQNDGFGEAMGAYMTEQGIGEAYIMSADYQAGYDMVAAFKRTFQGSIAGEVYTDLGATDYSTPIADINAALPESVFMFYPGSMGISFLTHYAESGLATEIPLYATAANGDETIVDIVGESALGLINSSPWSNDLDNEANLEFVSEFAATYGRNPTDFAAQGYDTGRLLISALNQVGGNYADTAGLRVALRNANFDSVRGSFAFGANQFPIQSWHIRQVVEGNEPGDLTNRRLATVLPNHGDIYADDCSLG